ncbi:hypothetical protein T12_15772 [Trichinella patagoniensis]|uniref:Uncharacterized protein n=1 Tax=Trichinella patagoniensis TaxID=990121 RepID=A0A0V0ZPS0_9BILA|nr:hypothetical protein T12_15772 [Trichinella patagoniensis]
MRFYMRVQYICFCSITCSICWVTVCCESAVWRFEHKDGRRHMTQIQNSSSRMDTQRHEAELRNKVYLAREPLKRLCLLIA